MKNQLDPERLRLAREKCGITMAEASRRLNLSKIGYCRYEYGERLPSPQTMEVIAQCFHTSVSYLTGQTDNPEPSRIIIDKEKDPELFELVKLCNDTDSSQITRLLAYCKALMG